MVATIAALVAILLAVGTAGFFWINGRIRDVPGVIGDYAGRPAATPGTNWLMVGSDSREGLDKSQRSKMATGKVEGKRTDSMMLLHIPENDGRPTLVSLPRDTAVNIPGNGWNKLNAAFADALKGGGPHLLVRTVEGVTGLRIDHYMELGFSGFVNVVKAIGGVEVNVREDINDRKAGLKLKKGTQLLNGTQALGYVRTRYNGALPDYERTKRQREFLGAVVKKVVTPGVLLNPFDLVPLAGAVADAVEVSAGTSAFDLLSLAMAMGNNPVTTVVPFGDTVPAGGGEAVRWDKPKADRLFNALRNDQQVPKDVLSKS